MSERAKKLTISRKPLLALSLAVWGTAVMAGTLNLVRYSNTPGPSASSAQMWPAGHQIPRTPNRANLVMAIHPDCPCSRASMNELEVLIARCHGKLSATVLFVAYLGHMQDITDSDLWQAANKIPDVTCVRDTNGKLSNLFNAKTSGQVFLYDNNSQLRFTGGITDSRGHAGDNAGLYAIQAILNHSAPTTTNTPVYGCTLR